MDEIPKCPLGNKECDSIALGTLLDRFRHMSLYPEATSLMEDSVENLKKLTDGLTYPSIVYLADPTVVEGCSSISRSCGCGHTTATTTNITNTLCDKCFRYIGVSQPSCYYCSKVVPLRTMTSPCVFCPNNLCRTCGKQYRASSTNEAPNHASCGPIAEFKSEVATIVAKVEGLNLTRFVKGHLGGSNVSIPTDPWQCLEFK